MDSDTLPPLELPAISIDLEAAAQTPDGDDEIVLLFDKKKSSDNGGGDEQEDPFVDWRSHDKIRSIFAHRHDALPFLVSHFVLEERSSFKADLAWKHIVPGTSGSGSPTSGGGKKGGAGGASSGKPSGSPTSPGNQNFSHYQQQQGKKTPGQSQQSKKGAGAVRGELGSNVAGAEKINIATEEYAVDWYAVLKVEETASESQLRSAFRRRCLETHPDKCQGSDAEFKKVQRAFEILGSADSRKQFDSSREFDDSIPPDGLDFGENDFKGFVAMFGPVFARNSRWSAVPVTVHIGEEDTPIYDVRRFYDFWLSFRSWRDFSHVAELEEIHDSMAREEKRWYQRENERILAAHKKQEVKRVRELVDKAMACDPRLKADERRAAEEKEAVKRAKEGAVLAAKMEKEKAERDAVEKAAAAKREAKEAEVRARQALKDAKAKVFSTLRERGILDEEEEISKGLVDGKVRPANIEWVFGKLQQGKDPHQLSDKILGSDNLVADFNKLVLGLERSSGMTRYGEPIAKESAASPKNASGKPSPASASAVWSDEDLLMLTKGIAKFPPGTVDRWRRLSIHLRDKFTEEQCLQKVKELEHSAGAAAAKKAGEALSSGPAANPSSSSSAAASASATPAGAAGAAAVASSSEEWTVKQQQQLEDGLRALKEYKEKDKFIKVSEYVTGKNARQCFERFQHLLKLKKAAAGK